MQSAPDVMQCYRVTGNADFTLILSARDVTDHEGCSRRHSFPEDTVLRFRTSVVMDRVKTGFAILVEQE